MTRFALALAFILSLAGSALAQSAPASAPSKEKAKPGQPEVMIFTDADTIDGRVVGPDDGHVVVKKKKGPSSLIKIRDNFNPEIYKSVHEL